MELAIPLSKQGEPLFRQVYLGLRPAILAGSFSPGERLPSSRDLAEQLGVSRTVALAAYDQLLAEGFVEGHRGSGTFAPHTPPPPQPRNREKPASLQLSRFGHAAAAATPAVEFPSRQPPALR